MIITVWITSIYSYSNVCSLIPILITHKYTTDYLMWTLPLDVNAPQYFTTTKNLQWSHVASLIRSRRPLWNHVRNSLYLVSNFEMRAILNVQSATKAWEHIQFNKTLKCIIKLISSIQNKLNVFTYTYKFCRILSD